jgi:hypothetical protein
LAAAGLLGLRHATDPDHVAAVVTLAADRSGGIADAVRLGVFWGLGHAATLLALGVPLILLGMDLPPRVESAAEAAVGVIIVALAVRLLRRWRAGAFHTHEHEHEGGLRHRHLHAHADGGHEHEHGARTPIGAFGVGIVHGAGGSAGVTVAALATSGSPPVAVAVLAVLALGSMAGMAVISSGFGWAVHRGRIAARFAAAVPALGLASLLFGGWYGATAILTV